MFTSARLSVAHLELRVTDYSVVLGSTDTGFFLLTTTSSSPRTPEPRPAHGRLFTSARLSVAHLELRVTDYSVVLASSFSRLLLTSSYSIIE